MNTTNTSPISAQEMFKSLNGFDEIAIANHFGSEISDIAQSRPIQFLRALVFVDKRRSGSTDADAKREAMEVTIGGVNEYFAEEPDDFDPADPDSEAGKDSSHD